MGFIKNLGHLALISASSVMGALLCASVAHAGLQNIQHYVPESEYSLGFEPELTLSNGAGMGGNLKYQKGISSISTLEGIIGTGGGPRGFRVGGNLTFDVFPDDGNQVGLGFAPQTIYYRNKGEGQLEVTLVPYLHKTYVSSTTEVEPFVSVPFGMAFADGNYHSISSLVVGAMFKGSDNVRFTTELGIAINRAETYVAGGITYYHP